MLLLGDQALGRGNLIPGIQLQLQEVKNSKASQFFGLMGKRVGGRPPIQPGARTGYHLERMVQGLLGRGGVSTEGTEEEDQISE
ncbi:tachykinin-4 isoform X2 [Castor canadensis]|uniref:Tachykinin-4 isoform X2 n=1 Tax=Castor canadensis TaxID=51338 RepID=A0AC58KAX6_CASCN